jgi:hypothetical protein
MLETSSDQRRVIVTGRSERKGAILNVKSTKFYSILWDFGAYAGVEHELPVI